MTRNPVARMAALFSLILPFVGASPALADSPFAVSLGVDVTNAYFYRGILQERRGVQFQPYVDASYSLYSADDGFIRGVTAGVGGWWSLHTEHTGANESPSSIYEGDYYAYLGFDLPGNVSMSTTYTFLTSPNDAFSTTQEFNLGLAWDDSEAFGAWSLQPWANLTVETNRTAFGPDEGVGLQLGIEPTLYAAEDDCFTLTLPAEVGLALDDYYESDSGGENAFGFANIGLAASIPLTFIPESAGSWSLGLAAKYYFFNGNLETANDGDSTYPVGTLSLGVEF